MRYSDLISFQPIEDIVHLTAASDKAEAAKLAKTYVMSDTMAENLKVRVIGHLQMDDVVDNKGVLVIGNYGTGKSHLMSVISAVAGDADNLQYLQNKKFASDMERVAGKFEVLRLELTGVKMPLIEIVFGFIKDDFDQRGIKFKLPDFAKVKDNKKLMLETMALFNAKYPGKGYLLVIDELLGYLDTRNAQELVRDLEFLRIIGELCSKSRLRFMAGMQEKLFDNPKFSFVASTLGHVHDRLDELTIAKEDTAYVVSERVLKKTPEQKALIRDHLEKFSPLYSGMANRLDEFVEMFPIHPAYIDVFSKAYLIENRHALKNITAAIRDIFHQELPEDAPGIISFDDYWPKIKQQPTQRTNPEVRRVLEASEKLEDIISHSFPKKLYKPLAIKIIYALSVHRLTTNGLDVEFGLTAENLKDDLCLYLPLPEREAEFLLGIIEQTLKDIMSTVSGQFIIHNDSNGQYFIDVNKTVDYDEKIKQRATLLSADELNRYFYQLVYNCLEWDAKQYVANFEIYQRDLMWDSHNIYREGYLFMGLPGERSTAQPERDFYIHVMPPYGRDDATVKNLPDEVYLYFKSSSQFKEWLELFAAAHLLAAISEGKDKNTYLAKAETERKRLVKFLGENAMTCFDVAYDQQKRQLVEILKGRYNRDLDFPTAIDLAASLCLDDYFCRKYPNFPVLKTRLTRKNAAETTRAAYNYFAGQKTKLAVDILTSLELLDDGKIAPEKSRYADYFIKKLKKLPPQGVINYDDIFAAKYADGFGGIYEDKHFGISGQIAPVIFLSLVYAGYAAMTLGSGKSLTAASLDQIAKISDDDLQHFKYISRPAEIPLAELKKLFDVLEINPALLDNPKTRDAGVEKLLEKAQYWSEHAIFALQELRPELFNLWGEMLAPKGWIVRLEGACQIVSVELSNYKIKYNTPAKLINFNMTAEQIDILKNSLSLVRVIDEYGYFKNVIGGVVTYLATIDGSDIDSIFAKKLDAAKTDFRQARDTIMNGAKGHDAAQKIVPTLAKLKDEYIERYFAAHQKRRLDVKGDQRRRKVQESKTAKLLKKLCSIDVLQKGKFAAIVQGLAEIKVCYSLTTSELKSSPVCPHCHYKLGEKGGLAKEQVTLYENQLGDLLAEWQQYLRDEIAKPTAQKQKSYLKDDQRAVIDAFSRTGQLIDVDDFFVGSVKTLLHGIEPVAIDPTDIIAKLDNLGPCDVPTFKKRLETIINGYLQGKDPSKLRIVIKHDNNEE